MFKGIKQLGQMGGMMKKMQEMQTKMQELQASFQEMVFEEEFAGGHIKIAMTGEFQVKSLDINPEFVDVDDMEMLNETLAQAYNEMHDKITNFKMEKMSEITGGLDLGGMGGLLG